MILTEKETTTVKDLQTQEQTCIEKYQRYSGQAKDPILKDLLPQNTGWAEVRFPHQAGTNMISLLVQAKSAGSQNARVRRILVLQP